MPCLWPRRAWRHRTKGTYTFRPQQQDDSYESRYVPCGGCIECRVVRAAGWALRCTLELHQHHAAAWVTLTYADEHLVRPTPELQATLYKPHLQGYLKRLRERVSPAPVRFFGVGEYGDSTMRPHYHVILYGVDPENKHIAKAWPFGHTRAEPVTPANIAYTAGYASKKIRPAGGDPIQTYTDPETGEYFEWQEPFRLCSRRPGIGGAARRHASAWRDHAVHQGRKVPVPRYLHDAYRAVATEQELAELDYDRQQLRSQQRARFEEIVGASWEDYYRAIEAREARLTAKYDHQTQSRSL